MQEGSDLNPPGPLDPLFAENLHTIQNIYSKWYDKAEPISINAELLTSNDASDVEEGRTATFFTGGVDSFYTLLKHKEKIDTLVYVHGFDVDLEDEKLRQQVSDMVQEVGNELEKEVIEIETSLRSFSNDFASWGRYHGGALAAVGHALRESISTVFVPSTHTYADLFPWGSHPLLDPLWGTRSNTFIHDGCESSRAEKCKEISKYDVALENLRTCFRNPGSSYNCGECNKCMRTKVNLYSVGKLSECKTFESKIDLNELHNTYIQDDNSRAFVRENLSALKNKSEKDRDLIKALESTLNPPPLWRKAGGRIKSAYYGARIRVGSLLRKWGVHPRE